MAKVSKTKKGKYKVVFSEEEFHIVAGIMHDLAGAPGNPFVDEDDYRVGMYYKELGMESVARPRKRTKGILRGLSIAMTMVQVLDPMYDWYDHWKEKPLDSAG